ncbi:hypothetical protein Scep_027748 [Stephania cephalantha]|uniref:Uncharacterized protein n=1 Tax=Stephania cephalantha TaxID=152367 RepID=A0AAP0HLE3_9MAGN
MTITNEDVRVLLGILITSKTMVAPFKDSKSLTTMVSRLLEVSVTDVDGEIKIRPGFTVSLVSHPFAETPEHTTGSMTRIRTLWCTLKVNLIVDDVFQMADQVIAFLSGAEHTYEKSIATASQSEGGTTSTKDVLHYSQKEKDHLRRIRL